jgi:hypothetical protein
MPRPTPRLAGPRGGSHACRGSYFRTFLDPEALRAGRSWPLSKRANASLRVVLDTPALR